MGVYGCGVNLKKISSSIAYITLRWQINEEDHHQIRLPIPHPPGYKIADNIPYPHLLQSKNSKGFSDFKEF